MTSLKTDRLFRVASVIAVLGWGCANAQTPTQLPFETDFETDEGFTLGPLTSDAIWLLGPNLSASIITPGAESTQALSFTGSDSLGLWMHRGGASVSWLDFYLMPVFVGPAELLQVFDAGQSLATGFVQSDPARGEIYVVDGDGFGGGQWLGSGESIAMSGAVASDWIRLSYRIDYTTRTWDLFVDGDLVLTDLGFLDAARSNEWRRVTVKMDYAAQAYDFYLDGERLGAGLGFAHPQPFISKFSAQGAATLDDLSFQVSEPAGLDDDRDGLTNAEEAASGLDALAFDSDGDGLADSLELLWGLDPNVPDATLVQPVEAESGVLVWTTSFALSEGFVPGLLGGQQHWAAAGNSEVTVTEEAAMPVDWLTDASFERMVGMGETRRVWVSFRGKLVAGNLPSLGDYAEPLSAAFGAASPSTIAVWDGVFGEWAMQLFAADREQWNGYALHLDYVEKSWGLYLNGVTVAEGLPFRENHLVTFSRFKALKKANNGPSSEFEAASAQFDNIRVANTEPADMDFDGDGLANDLERQIGSDPKLADTDADGMPDLREYENSLDFLGDDAGMDPDADGLFNVEEYALGFDPNLADAKGAAGYATAELWHGVSGNDLANLTNDPRFPLSAMNMPLLPTSSFRESPLAMRRSIKTLTWLTPR